EREITPETPPFIRSEYGRLTQAIKTGDREAVQAIATEAAENPRLQSVYDRAYEALAVMKEQPVAQASKRASQTKQIAITESDVKRQVADYMAKNKRTPAATNTPAPTTQTPIANTTATHTTATTAPADPQMPAIKPENYKAIVKKATADIEAAQERFNKEWEAATAAKDKYKIDWIKKQIGAIPAAKRILPKLKMGEAWVNDVIKGTGRHKVNALLFELDGFKLALYRSPVKYGGTAARNNWGVLETKSGGGFGAPTEASASDALISAMAMYETVGRKNGVKRAVDSWIANYGKANPNAPTTRQTAKPQTPATAAKTADRKSDFINSQKTEPTPTATETTATSKASAEIEQALAQTQQIIDDRIAKMQRRLAKEKVSLKESVIFSERYDSAMGEVNGLERQIANYRKYSKVIPQLKLNPDKAWAWDVKTNKYIAVEGSSFDYAGNRYIAHRTFREKGPNTAKFEVTEVTSGDYTGGGANAVTAITSALGHIDRAIADGFPINYLSSIKDHGRSPYVFASPHASGAAIGSTAGFERDENGNLRYNAAKGLAGALGGFAIASKLNNRFNKPQAFATQKTQNLGRNANSVAQNTIKQQGASVNSIFGGENAANAPLTPLQEAKRLARRGASDKAIHAKTGWFKDRDGKWKFEIDDSKWKLDASVVDKLKQPNHENIYLGDLLKHDELFKQYPTLRKKVVFAARKDLGVDGLYTGNLIIYPLNRPEVLIHEIQHAVQDIEGFARGGSEYLDFDYYRNLHGEAEARNAQWRRGLTAAERAKSYPPSTFDVDPKKTFVLDENGNSIAASEAKAIEPLDTEAVKRLSQGNDKIYISELNADETKEIVEAFKRQYGEDVAFKVPQITRTINGDQIRHTLKNHGDPKTEAARGNIAVTLEDIAKYPEIVKDHTRKIYSHTKGGKPAIVYGKQEKGYTIIVEEIRTGRGDIAFFDMYKHKGTLTEDSLKLAKDKANDGKGRLPTLFHGVRERSATPAQAESVAQAATKSQGVKAQSPVHVGSSAAGFVIGGSSGENGWSNERALLGAAGGFALASRFGKRDLRKTYDNAVKSRQAFDDITGSLGSLKRTWKNTLSEGYEAIREARNVKLNVEANKLERLHKAIATEFNEAERKALHEYVAGETQTIAPHIKPLADHV
ncbi:MAG: hypothetical protein LBO72_09810, partial [Helicobacteraceae bacterium]|nr:hypothetical protein [Helicobacteraceae bacterium]